ncbi:MAG: peptide chain release factor N(5)-glutamine methyltransferase [Pseudomonadota bacterium]
MSTVQAALLEGTRALKNLGIDSAQTDARWLMAKALDVPKDRLTLVLPDEISASQFARFQVMLEQRFKRQPVSQILSERTFFSRNFRVTSDVLDPRPETERLVEIALQKPFQKVADLGTGSGCILLTLLAETTGTRGVGGDVSEAALEVAKSNCKQLQLAGRATFIVSDWFSAFEGSFDLIVSNPPYIELADIAHLSPEVRDWEPHLALTTGTDTLQAYREIARSASRFLAPRGRILLEHGVGQAGEITEIFSKEGWSKIQSFTDLTGRARVLEVSSPKV